MKTTGIQNFSTKLFQLLCVAGCIGATALSASAATFTFATYSWDQDNTPDVGTRLGNSANLGGAIFSSGLPGTSAGDVGFPDQAAGSHALSTFNTALTTARLTGVAITANTSRPLNLPSGNDGTATRHGVELGWTGGRSFVNGGGDDFVVYESSSSSGAPENPMVRVRFAGTNTFSNWFYFAPDTFQLYVGNASEGAFATGVDLSDMGLASSDSIDLIQVANLIASDRISGMTTHSFGGQNFGIGQVVFDGSTAVKPDPGAFATSFRDTGYGASTLDPDILYVGMLDSQVVPEPATLLLVGIGVIGAAGRRNRRNG
jgi:hypothetical protein